MRIFSTSLVPAVVIALFCLYGSDALAVDKPDQSPDLRDCSITPGDIGFIEEKPRELYICRVGPGWIKKFSLSRVGAANCVAVVVLYPGNKIVLNPNDGQFNYGLIPSLSKITRSEAQILWGTQQSSESKSDEETYKLTDKDQAEFFIDITYEKEHVTKYRVRSLQLDSSPWISLD